MHVSWTTQPGHHGVALFQGGSRIVRYGALQDGPGACLTKILVGWATKHLAPPMSIFFLFFLLFISGEIKMYINN